MRTAAAAALALLLLPTLGAAQTQDDLLNEVIAYGDEAFFQRYPGLLVAKLGIASRLQSATATPAQLADYDDLTDVLQGLRDLDLFLRAPDAAGMAGAFEDMQRSRAQIEAFTNATTSPYRPLLLVALDDQIQQFIAAVDQIAPTQAATAQRISLLGLGRDAAQLAQDAVDYSRLDATHRILTTGYERDMAIVDEAIARARGLTDTAPPPFLSAAYAPGYAALLDAEDASQEAARLANAHGEAEKQVEAAQLASAVDARADSMALRLFGGLLAFLLLVLALGWAVAARLARWAADHALARGGDELALQV